MQAALHNDMSEKRRLTFPVLLLVMALFMAAPFLTPTVRAQDDPKPAAGNKDVENESSRRKKLLERWERLSEREREKFKKRFEYFRKLSPEEQVLLKARHEELVRLRDRIVAENKEKLGNLTPDEKKRFVERKVRKEIRKREKAWLREGNGPGHDKERLRRARKEFEAKNRKQAEAILRKLVKDGVITRDEMRRIMSLPHRDKVFSVLDLERKRFLNAMQPCLPPDELKRFRDMPPHRFHGELFRQKREKGLFGPFARLCELTPEQRVEIDALPDEAEREKKKRHFFNHNFRSRLRAMGVKEAMIKELAVMPLRRRLERTMKLLLEIPPDKVLPGLRDILKKGPPPRGPKQHHGKKRPPRRPPPQSPPKHRQ